MNTTIIYRDRVSEVSDAVAQGDDLWLPIKALHSSTDWELTPEGACIGEMCIPIPDGREGEFLTEDGKLFNLPALERTMGWPMVHDEAHSVWLFGEGAAAGRRLARSAASAGLHPSGPGGEPPQPLRFPGEEGLPGLVGLVVRVPPPTAGLAGAVSGAKREAVCDSGRGPGDRRRGLCCGVDPQRKPHLSLPHR